MADTETKGIVTVATKGGGAIDVETEKLPDDVYTACLKEGLKSFINARMTKFTIKDLEGEDLEAALTAIAERAKENLEALYAGKTSVRKASAKAGKVPGVVMTEARRIARNLVKDEIKRAGLKVSHYAASEITSAANALIEQDPALIEQAKAALAEREKPATKETVATIINVKSFKVDAGKVAASKKKADALKASKAGQLSAKQAGMVKVKAKPTAQATAH